MADDKRMFARGSAELFLGPMFSEKTTEVGRKIKRARLGGRDCVLVKHVNDKRYSPGASVKTHDGRRFESDPGTGQLGGLRVVTASRLLDVDLGPSELNVGVDEGQFFPDLPEALEKWTSEGRHVYVSALDGDFRRRPFGRVGEALPFATRVAKLTAICMYCSSRFGPPVEASFTVRTTPDEEQVVVGEQDMYKAACLNCYLRETGRET